MYLYRDVCAFLVLVCESLHSLSSNMVKFQGYLGFFFSSSSMETWRFPWMQYSTRSAICCFLSVITEGKHSWPLKICIVYCCICKRSIMKSVWIRKVVCFVSKLFKTKGELIITFFFSFQNVQKCLWNRKHCSILVLTGRWLQFILRSPVEVTYIKIICLNDF